MSLWMELFPQEQTEEDGGNQVSLNIKTHCTVLQLHGMGLVVVRESKVVGLHCSGAELHAGQAAIIQHGARLADCQLYFSRRPCATCLKMIINAGVSQISFWPGDPEISILNPAHFISEEALLDAVAVEKLKSNSRPHICTLLQPLAPGLAQFVTETSRNCDFTERITDDDPKQNTEELFNRYLTFLVRKSQQHQEILKHMGLENFCVEPYFSSLRNNMRELVEVLAAVAAGVPQQHYGFYRSETLKFIYVPQEVARHCMIQARLLAYRTEDPKVGVGTVIWAKGQSVSSQYAEYPQMDAKQEDRQRRKYRYIIHAEQNALTFRTRDIKPDEPTMLFVTKCPCDECVPLIRGAGITHIYTSDQDRDKDKGDISYLRFGTLKNISKFIVNGCVGKHSRQTESESPSNKKLCTSMSCESPAASRR
uniref:Cytidine and dCMP deaminase domain-containing protein 1 n=1 Tax=Neolamprologus brichardi TaxID=32507 RepID=A0A3Q4GP92_NEOBR